MNDPWLFGWTLTILGMGGTLLSLWVLSLLIGVLKKLFPHDGEHAHRER
jgi:Na+-transporting methylmalonyl-CoA/oxaloacetate decarboxylase gamma subunit